MARAIHTLDLNFQNRKNAIAAYLIPHSEGAALVESGPGSTIDSLKAEIAKHGFTVNDLTHVFLSHIHLDHAGAAGWLAQQGVQVCVHPRGAPHLLNPEKLIASATRIYKEDMDRLWGDFLAVPEDKLIAAEDGQEITVGDLKIKAIHTPGHAEHHISWGIEDDIVFTGDIGGVRMFGYGYVRLPLVPPELHLERWHDSLEKLLSMNFKRIAPTHFGVFDDAEWHINAAIASVASTSRWLDEVMPSEPSIDELGKKVVNWMLEEALAEGVSEETLKVYEIANPLHMSSTGLARYWTKFRQAAQSQ
ncbi:MAG: MBL fold metallo-hydrolase [Anaerolineae bacterium]|jgi:glyoxylase-like metal-dependent hydrolase (beta-lactamase superfamily II)|nr:MBL fold metallo-hydrolase [Anaerolineae bacterium]MBT4311888.1 MBL fold metallo-hydrolase [Anaerolineae bacterium]MBT4458683.1 MBL fold metallo-hydrolase [Anaerolineae bacterium]MBT4841404.1 MBL fold metallo-hydrolase [Anaerolineae bacterium]MBT6060490.1 MBL fold metallo-hydrolase [Anaerolineae bacterium]